MYEIPGRWLAEDLDARETRLRIIAKYSQKGRSNDESNEPAMFLLLDACFMALSLSCSRCQEVTFS